MKKVFILMALSVCLNYAQSQSKELKNVEKATSNLIAALESGDRASLEKITMANLTYGHSNGLVETQEEFVEKFATGKSDFVTINTSNQQIFISGKTAIVRHRLDAVTKDNGKDGEAHLNVMIVFQKDKGEWKMLARQSVKIVS